MKLKNRHLQPNGFALVVTLSLMILLTIIAVGLLTLSSVSLRAAGQGEAMATARNNARLALMLALGDLQKSLGPDKAITATSGILAAAPGKPNLTGAWESWDPSPLSPPSSYKEEKASRFRGWLVSNSLAGAVKNSEFAATAWPNDPNETDTATLVGKESLGGVEDESLWSRAGKVSLTRNKMVQGTYAWHVSDEAVKARINLYRDSSRQRNVTLARKRGLLAGHRPDVTVVRSNQGGGEVPLDFLPEDIDPVEFAKGIAAEDKISSMDQVGFIENSGDAPSKIANKIRPFRNDVTPYSVGLPTNARLGGLKKDLSSVFETTTSGTSVVLPPDFRVSTSQSKRLFESTHGITGPSDPYWSALASYYNAYRGMTDLESKPRYTQRLTESRTVGSMTPPRTFYPGPVIAKVEMLLGFVVRDAHATAWGGPTGNLTKFNPKMKYMGHLLMTPLVTIHNPYNVSISFSSMQVMLRNIPVAFKFYVDGQPQGTDFTTISDMFVSAKRDKTFALRIANWTDPRPGNTATSGDIVLAPGQSMVCSPYINPSATFNDALAGGGSNNTNGNDFFDWENIDTGVDSSGAVQPVKARPGFHGKGIGFDLDWLTPKSSPSSDGGAGVLGLIDDEIVRPADPPVVLPKVRNSIYMEYKVLPPAYGVNDRFEVSTKIISSGREFDYGGMLFRYNAAALSDLFGKTFRFPAGSSTLYPKDMYHANTIPINAQNLVKSVALFSAYSRTTSGGVFETGRRTQTAGALNVLRDGSLAGKPFYFHNPAKPNIVADLGKEKPGGHSHELNFQPLTGEVDNVFETDATNRGNLLTGNTTGRGIKTGSYLEVQTGPMHAIADFRRSNALSTAHLPSFVQPVGNSVASPLMSTDKVKETDASLSTTEMLDQSYLANHALYDNFYFSSFASDAGAKPDAVFRRFMANEETLMNQNLEPWLPAGKSIAEAEKQLFVGSKPTDEGYKYSALYQRIRGSFNVNSTSVQAWKAVLASMNKTEVLTYWAKSLTVSSKLGNGIPILPMSLPNGASSLAPLDSANTDNLRSHLWNGYRELNEQELQTLAEKIVEQVRLRGPFLSLSEFVNRQLGPASPESRRGALEAALEASMINENFLVTPDGSAQVPIGLADVQDSKLYGYKTPETATGNPAAGAPGWISQGDLMKVLEATATVRGDTFVVRVQGEAKDPSGKVTARAYGEAVVQRTIEYVDPTNGPEIDVNTDSRATAANKTFGRRMEVVSFRWLDSKEI